MRSRTRATSPVRSAPWRPARPRSFRSGARARRRASCLRLANCRKSGRPRSPHRSPARRVPTTPPQPRAEEADPPPRGLTLAPAGQVAGSGSDGVVVTEVDPNGLASEHGFRTGDVILDVGGQKAAGPPD